MCACIIPEGYAYEYTWYLGSSSSSGSSMRNSSSGSSIVAVAVAAAVEEKGEQRKYCCTRAVDTYISLHYTTTASIYIQAPLLHYLVLLYRS